MPDVVYFLTGPEGQWELSDGEQQIGHIEQVGLAFEIKPVAGSILDGMEAQPYPSKQEALRAIELDTGRSCEPAVMSRPASQLSSVRDQPVSRSRNAKSRVTRPST